MRLYFRATALQQRFKFALVAFLFFFQYAICMAQGLHGYISSSSVPPPNRYGLGVGFYTAVWQLTPSPLRVFQVGMPGTWLTPENKDDTTATALCPVGTYAADSPDFLNFAPTYDGVFQTIEGSPGYWIGNKFHHHSPKFMMNGTPTCYDYLVSSPGFSFFTNDGPLNDSSMGIAQLSNRLLIPPDGLPFRGNPSGQLMGFTYMALPLTKPYFGEQYSVGEKSWTLFLNTNNFKGPLAFYVPDIWAKISKHYAYDNGRGLDQRMLDVSKNLGGTIEINTVPKVSKKIQGGRNYVKIPPLQFPVDSNNYSIISKDVTFYDSTALYDDILAWRDGGAIPTGTFNALGAFKAKMYNSTSTGDATYDQDLTPVRGINEIASPVVIDSNAFALHWNSHVTNGTGTFPQYFKDSVNISFAIDSTEVPAASGLHTAQFAGPNLYPTPYVAPLTGAWGTPGPVAGPYQTILPDSSLVTYYWYRFIDQPVFQQYHWTEGKKDSLQRLIESIHTNWSTTQSYMAPPSSGDLVEFDTSLFVRPPFGYEIGYVPIVTKQELFSSLPVIITTDASAVTSKTATSGGAIINTLFSPITSKGICYDTATNPTILNRIVACGSDSAAFVAIINGLTPHTTYNVRAYAINSAGIGYGNNVSFTTDSSGSIFNNTDPNQFIVLYPNPATNQLYFETGDLTIEQINIYNAAGSLVMQTENPVNKYINIRRLPAGVYIAEIKTKDATVKRKWVKQ